MDGPRDDLTEKSHSSHRAGGSAAPSSPDGSANGDLAAEPLAIPDRQIQTEWCAHCKADVVPRGKGLCPRCGRFLRNHFASRKHPINLAARELYLRKLVADFQPHSVLEVAACEGLAATLERLDSEKPGTTERLRLLDEKSRHEKDLMTARAARDGAGKDGVAPEARVLVVLPWNQRDGDPPERTLDDCVGRPEPSEEPEPCTSGSAREPLPEDVTDADLAACLSASGDLDAYRSGTLSHADAIEMVRAWQRQTRELEDVYRKGSR